MPSQNDVILELAAGQHAALIVMLALQQCDRPILPEAGLLQSRAVPIGRESSLRKGSAAAFMAA
jgi:hypothetical protein